MSAIEGTNFHLKKSVRWKPDSTPHTDFQRASEIARAQKTFPPQSSKQRPNSSLFQRRMKNGDYSSNSKKRIGEREMSKKVLVLLLRSHIKNFLQCIALKCFNCHWQLKRKLTLFFHNLFLFNATHFLCPYIRIA